MLSVHCAISELLFSCNDIGSQTGVIGAVSDQRCARNDTTDPCGRYKDEQCFAVTVYVASVRRVSPCQQG
jgi:hypothetical protein